MKFPRGPQPGEGDAPYIARVRWYLAFINRAALRRDVRGLTEVLNRPGYFDSNPRVRELVVEMRASKRASIKSLTEELKKR